MRRRTLQFSRALPVLALLMLAAGARACGGSDFSTADDASGGTCLSPSDCDDGDPCTIDVCGAEGVCGTQPKCSEGLKCCSGTCGECCSSAECDDGVDCTSDECVAGFCSSAPGACGDGEYCSIPRGGCVPLEPCETDASCDDGDACTVDACDGAFCQHDFCPSGGRCCSGQPDLGCNSCCSNSECSDEDLCSVDTCTAEGCQHVAKTCADGSRCCPDTGECAKCCTREDCDDGIACTNDRCGAGTCEHVPRDDACGPGEICQVGSGCVPAVSCGAPDECPPPSTECAVATCVDSICAEKSTCSDTEVCCAGVCAACCENEPCPAPEHDCVTVACEGGECLYTPHDELCASDAAQVHPEFCDVERGCVECVTAADCGDDPCFTFTCSADGRCVQGAQRVCNSSVDGTGTFACVDCCQATDCPLLDGGERQTCCRGQCCSGWCNNSLGTCSPI